MRGVTSGLCTINPTKFITTNMNRLRDVVQIIFNNLNQLTRFIKLHKDNVTKNEQKNVVYCIKCDSCDTKYIGQTKRQLNTRIKEHLNHVRKEHEETSVVADHIYMEHNFR